MSAQVALGRGSGGKELNPPTNRQGGTEASCQWPCESSYWKEISQAQLSLHMISAPPDICNLKKVPMKSAQLSLLQIPDPQKM